MKGQKNIAIFTLICVCLIHHAAAFLQMTKVCNSNNATEPLNCIAGQWLQIMSEAYIPQAQPQTNNTNTDSSSDSSCEFDFSTDCSLVKTDMNINCHGPMSGDSCRELVDVTGIRLEASCFNSVKQVAVMVQYDCIDGSNIINLCNGDHTSPTVYLASPNFPYTMPQNTVCVCNIQGPVLAMRSLHINVNSKLPWSLSDQYSSVLTVKNSTSIVWQSSNLCKNCSSLHLLNEDLGLSKSPNSANISVTYSNFGLSNQVVWLQVIGQGQSLSVSCRSSPLPSERIITTTIPTTSIVSESSSFNTTSQQSMSASSTEQSSAPTISTSTVEQQNTNTTVETTSTTHETGVLTTTLIYPTGGTSSTLNKSQTLNITTDLTNPTQISKNTSTEAVTITLEIYNTASTTNLVFTTLTATSSVNKLTSPLLKTDASKYVNEGSNKTESPTLIILLAVILFVLLIIAVIVGVIVFRKRRRFNYQGKKGFKALFLSLYDQLTNNIRNQENDQDNAEFHNGSFDAIELSDGDVQSKDSMDRPDKMLQYTSVEYKGNNSNSSNIADVSNVLENTPDGHQQITPADKTFVKDVSETLKTQESHHEVVCSDQDLQREKNSYGDHQLVETSTKPPNDLDDTQFASDMTSGHLSSDTSDTNPDHINSGRSHKKHLRSDHQSSFDHCDKKNISPDGEENIHEVHNNLKDLDTMKQIRKRLKLKTEKIEETKLKTLADDNRKVKISKDTANIDKQRLPSSECVVDQLTQKISDSEDKHDKKYEDSEDKYDKKYEGTEGKHKKNSKSQLVSNILLQSLDDIKLKRKHQVQDAAEEMNSTKTSKDKHFSQC
ncbi:hypothetical protein Btru_034235 [Bulinus truncatus]|nr:hypothetical protein Btru_034235 [Bulinus truncatus]